MGPLRTKRTASVGRAELLWLMHTQETGGLTARLADSAPLCGFEAIEEPIQLPDHSQETSQDEQQPKPDRPEPPPEPFCSGPIGEP